METKKNVRGKCWFTVLSLGITITYKNNNFNSSTFNFQISLINHQNPINSKKLALDSYTMEYPAMKKNHFLKTNNTGKCSQNIAA